ncbi:MAG: VWA domain-containing protein [Chloroflexota bacterium]
MGLIFPAALGFIALAIPIIIFYMLRLRRQPMPISSLLLWQRVLEDQAANAPWQRLRRNLLLLLQLLLLALLVLALARPFREVEASVQGNLILLIDASASMQATDVAPSRLEVAKTQALDIVQTLRPDDVVNLIVVEDVPRPVLVSEVGLDRNAIETAIRDIEPTNTIANWETALALAAANATTQGNATVVILSDGAIPTAPPILPVPVQWRSVGVGANNQAIVALATREGRDGPQLFAQIANFAPDPVDLLIEIRVDEQLFDARNLSLAPYPEGTTGLTFTQLPEDTRFIEARLTYPNLSAQDDLALDNVAWTTRQQTDGRVLLVSNGNLFLERALSLVPGITVAQVAPDNYVIESEFSLTVFDRVVPDAVPEGNVLFIAPPTSTSLFTVQGTFSNTVQTGRIRREHPVIGLADFSNLHIAQAQGIEPPIWGTTLLNSAGGPLILAGDVEDRRVAIISFDLLKSDLPLQIDFPILTANLTRWFLDQSLPDILADDDSIATRQSAPNLLSASESNIQPDQAQVQGLEETVTADTQTLGQQEFWWILVIIAVVILVWEWAVYWRGGA